MQITFQITAADIEALLHTQPVRRGVFWAWLVAVMTVMSYFLLPTIVLMVFHVWYGLLVGGVLLGLLFYNLLSQFLRGRRRWRQVSGALEKGLTTVSLTPEQLEINSPLARSRRAWSDIKQVIRTKTHLLIMYRPHAIFGMPVHAFSNTRELEQCASLIENYMAQSRDVDRYPPDPTWRPPDNDFVRLQYDTTASEFVSFSLNGLRKTAPRQAVWKRWVGCLSLVVVGIVFAAYAGDADWLLQLLIGFVVYISLGVPSILLMHQISRLWIYTGIDKKYFRSRTLTISAAGIHSVDHFTEVLSLWPVIEGIDQDYRFVVIYEVKPNVAFLIPRRVFATDQDAEQFINKAIMYWERGHEAPEVVVALADMNNPYRSPMAE